MLQILQTATPHRTSTQLNELAKFLSDLPFFKERNLKLKDIQAIGSKLVVEEVNPHYCACVFGDKGDRFFIIVKGQCSIWLPQPSTNNMKICSDF
jgi:hypothetical protein